MGLHRGGRVVGRALFLIRAGSRRATAPGRAIAALLILGVGPVTLYGLYADITQVPGIPARLAVSPVAALAFLLTASAVWTQYRAAKRAS